MLIEQNATTQPPMTMENAMDWGGLWRPAAEQINRLQWLIDSGLCVPRDIETIYKAIKQIRTATA